MDGSLVWQFVTWVIASAAGGLVVAFTYGRNQGKREALLDQLAEKVCKLDEAVDTLETNAATARKSRKAMHEALQKTESRLDAGNAKFDGHMVKLAEQSTRLQGIAGDLSGFTSALGRLVTRDLCREKHQATDRRLDAIEQRTA